MHCTKVPGLEPVEREKKELVVVCTAASPTPATLDQLKNGELKMSEYKQFCPSFLRTCNFHKINFKSADLLAASSLDTARKKSFQMILLITGITCVSLCLSLLHHLCM